MPDSETLSLRKTAREKLLARAVTLLARDERVVAAWLYGSPVPGPSDAWSDLD